MFGWIKDSAVYEAGLIGSSSWNEESSSYKVQLPAEVLQEAARVMDKGYLFYVHGTIEAEGTESEFYLRANKMEANRILFAEGSSLTEGLLTISYFDLTHVETEVADLMNDVTDLKTAVESLNEISGTSFRITENETSNNYKLGLDGYRVNDLNYKTVKYRVNAGTTLRIFSDYLYQFQSSKDLIAQGGTLNRIGQTYSGMDRLVVVPDGATYLVVSTNKNTGSYRCDVVTTVKTLEGLNVCDKQITKDFIIQGTYNSLGTITQSDTRIRTSSFIEVKNGETIEFAQGSYTKAIFYGVFDEHKTFVRDGTWLTENGSIPITWDGFTLLVFRGETTSTYIAPSDFDCTAIIRRVKQSNGGDEQLPTYWQTNIDQKIPQIIANVGDAGMNGESFVFLTDIHWATNYKMSPRLVKEIINKTNVGTIILGGDALVIHDSKTDAEEEGTEVIRAFMLPNARLYNTFGNHDANFNVINNQVVSSEHMSYGEVYGSQFIQMDTYNVHYMNKGVDFSYYFDKPNSNTRFIVLDTGEGFLASGVTDPDGVARQDFKSYSQLHECLMNTQQGWHVIVIAHIMTNKPWYNIYAQLEGNNRKGTANVVDGNTIIATYDYTNAPATVEIAIGGHCHYDISGGQESNRYVPWVTVDCDGWDIKKVYTDENGNTIDRTGQVVSGTTTEQAFDVITVDYGHRVANFVRIGTRGNNRTFALKS